MYDLSAQKNRKRATFSDKVARAATFPHPHHKMFAAPGGEHFAAGARKSCPGRAGPAGAAKFKFKIWALPRPNFEFEF